MVPVLNKGHNFRSGFLILPDHHRPRIAIQRVRAFTTWLNGIASLRLRRPATAYFSTADVCTW